MGQVLRILQEYENSRSLENRTLVAKFPDLSKLPPEIGLSILANLNATDLCLAGCVWNDLANDEILWQSLCHSSWGYVNIYSRIRHIPNFSFKQLYMVLDEATLTFNADPFQGEAYLLNHGLVENNPSEIAKFLHMSKLLKADKKREYLNARREVLDELVKLQNFQNQFLPNALRKFFGQVSAPTERGDYLSDMIEKFSERFCKCNPKLGLNKDTVFVLCFSLIMLSVDLTSPHVKNKMSKREFIKNTKRAARDVSDDLAGHLYDNIYLVGHIAPPVA
ncbi:hypothetical protein ACJMK2_030808 [Sinanodonta woodiana]|uniref:SEC7 domain-containing protein n=1 Tax=Sinanodonta woodiana TaxID=1069815 RepID=A0ABD3WWW1_SINWO